MMEETCKRRLLIVTTVANTAQSFLLPYADHFRSQKWAVMLATSEATRFPELRAHFDSVIHMPWSRRALSWRSNLNALGKMRRVLRSGEFDLVHTHTPIASFITRLASMGLPKASRPKIIYTAHGFHFHRNGAWLPNAFFRLMEMVAGRSTDAVIVINREDEAAATRLRLGRRAVIYMPGIGIQLSDYDRGQFSNDEIERYREALGLSPGASLAVIVAEFNAGKRHEDVLKAIALSEWPDLHVAFAGEGVLLEETKQLAERLGLASRCHFLGFVRNVALLCASSQVMVLSSEREGLPRSIMEAMASGLPVVGADSRGIRDLLEKDCGLLFDLGDADGLATALERVISTPELAASLAANARSKIKGYEVRALLAAHERLYEAVCTNGALAAGDYSEAAGEAKFAAQPLPPRVMMIGGVTRSLTNFRGPLLRALRLAGYEVLTVASDRDAAAQAQLRHWGVRFRHLPMRRAAVAPLADVAYCRLLARLITKEDSATIIAYTHKPVIYSALAKFISANTQARCYGMITGLGYAFTDVGRNSPGKWIAGKSIGWLYKLATRHVDGVIFQNTDDQALFLELGLIAPGARQLVVRGSGIELEQYPFSVLPPGNPKVLLVARLLSEKGIYEWVAAARRVRAKYPLVEFHLVGPLDSNPTAISPEAVMAWQSEGVIIYHGAQEDVTPFLRHYCTVYVLPSYREGTPRTVLEAMATGRPVITTDVPGCRDTIFAAGPADAAGVRTGANGLLVPVRSVEALTVALERLLANPAQAARMGIEGRRLAEEYYDVRKVNEQILDFSGLSVKRAG